MKSVRLGIIGAGTMGAVHAAAVRSGQIPRCTLTAVADLDPARLSDFGDVAQYHDAEKLIAGGKVDAVLIATPHYSHTSAGIAALKQGLHVLVEKPISANVGDCRRLIAAHNGKSVFAAMFNQRTDPHYIALKELVKSGELGEIRRVNWIITDWFRSEAYYGSGGWRATWAGEGGGVLLNQCPHNLDLLQWIVGMPESVLGFCALGRYHDIEVEDDVTAYLKYANGATGVFITSTGEAPGTNRLEIAGERGRVVLENGAISFRRNVIPMSEFSRTTKERFAGPPRWEVHIPADGSGAQHLGIMRNFVDAILDGAPLIAPAQEGIHSVELANAMLYSSLRGEAVKLPLDASAYETAVNELIAKSTRAKSPRLQ